MNQTQENKKISSSFSNIRVINSFDVGLPQSRNIAINNAIGDVCLIADDDVEYVKDFEEIVKHTYNQIVNPSIVLFKIDTFTGAGFRVYQCRRSYDRSCRARSTLDIPRD